MKREDKKNKGKHSASGNNTSSIRKKSSMREYTDDNRRINSESIIENTRGKSFEYDGIKNEGYYINNTISGKSSNASEIKPNNKKQSKKKMNKVLKIILIVLITLLLVVVSIFGTYIYKSGGSISEAFKSMVKDVVGDQDPMFVLVMGVSEDISAELTDTLMLVGYNPDTNQAFVLSIPRDTFIGTSEAKAGGVDKINALYQKSPQKTVEAVENITGVKIDHYVTIKNSVLVDIVDSIGGVYFDVPINMDYDDVTQDLHIHLKSGYQKLNGNQAEQLVRFRHNNNGTSYSASYGDNDEGRMRTQREFLKVVAQQVIQTKSVDQIKNVVSSVFDNLVTNITLNKMIGYVPYAIDINMEDLQMNQLPGTPTKLNDLWFFKANYSETKTLVDGYFDKLGLTEAEKKQYRKESTIKNTTTQKSTTKNTTSNKNTTNNTNSSNASNKTKSKNTVNTTNTTTKSNESTNKLKNDVSNNTNLNSTIKNTVNDNTLRNENNSASENNTSSDKNENQTSKQTTSSNTTDSTEKSSEKSQNISTKSNEEQGQQSGSDN